MLGDAISGQFDGIKSLVTRLTYHTNLTNLTVRANIIGKKTKKIKD
jgi:hypothetical protein